MLPIRERALFLFWVQEYACSLCLYSALTILCQFLASRWRRNLPWQHFSFTGEDYRLFFFKGLSFRSFNFNRLLYLSFLQAASSLVAAKPTYVAVGDIQSLPYADELGLWTCLKIMHWVAKMLFRLEGCLFNYIYNGQSFRLLANDKNLSGKSCVRYLEFREYGWYPLRGCSLASWLVLWNQMVLTKRMMFYWQFFLSKPTTIQAIRETQTLEYSADLDEVWYVTLLLNSLNHRLHFFDQLRHSFQGRSAEVQLMILSILLKGQNVVLRVNEGSLA